MRIVLAVTVVLFVSMFVRSFVHSLSRVRRAAGQPGGRLDHCAFAAGILQQPLQKRLEACAVDDEQVAVGHLAHIRRGRLEAVWVDA